MIGKLKKYADEFTTFAIKGNVVDMAVGIIIGAAFGKIVDSLVKDIIMPPMGFLMGKVDFTNLYFTLPTSIGGEIQKYPTLEAAQAAGAVTINYGLFINTLISFILVSFAVFLMIKFINKLRAEKTTEQEAQAPTTKVCPKCCSEININATKCPFCTTDL